MIDRETVQKIKDAADIVEVVGEYVNLTKRGVNYMGLCPFHNERTPSFSVSPKRNFCHCFSCHKGGSPVNFIMEKEGISYHDALLWLAKKYNITVHEKELTDEERAKITERESMIVASEWAMRYFHNNLYNTEEGRTIGLSYFYQRGLTDEAIKRFMLGYSIDNGSNLLNAARNEGFDIEVFKKIGLIGSTQDRNYDKFRGRVMFPIRNTSGKPVAFGGRTLKGDVAKYINSPETVLYKKSNELYGIFEAKNDIVKTGRVYLMEGYLDVISSWQTGLTNVVASSGTALTEGQIALLHRFTDNVTLVYDGDPAGIKASLRGIDMLLSHKLHVNVLLLPEGHDPDSFSKKLQAEEYQKYIKNHQTDFIEFKASIMMKEAEDSPQERSRAILSVIESIACVTNEVERSLYIQKCSRLMDINEEVVYQQVAKFRKEKIRKLNFDRQRQEPSSLNSEEIGKEGKIVKEEQDYKTKNQNTIQSIERELAKYCIRYGFAPIDGNYKISPEGEFDSPLVVEYISEELDADQLSFIFPPHQKLFNDLLNELPSFYKKINFVIAEHNSNIENEREKFRDSLIESGISVSEIEKAEIKFEKEMESVLSEKIKAAALNFSGSFLMDHEDDEVRKVVNSLLEEKHRLSAIYLRDGRTVRMEEDRLDEFVPRAIAELRNEIVNQRVKELQKKISEESKNLPHEELQKLLHEVQKLLAIRSKLSLGLGERIISPR